MSGCVVYQRLPVYQYPAAYGQGFSNHGFGSKEGRASNLSILWLFAWGDAGTKAAADNGDISVIKHADQEFMAVLFGLYFRVTTVVYGD